MLLWFLPIVINLHSIVFETDFSWWSCFGWLWQLDNGEYLLVIFIVPIHFNSYLKFEKLKRFYQGCIEALWKTLLLRTKVGSKLVASGLSLSVPFDDVRLLVVRCSAVWSVIVVFIVFFCFTQKLFWLASFFRKTLVELTSIANLWLKVQSFLISMFWSLYWCSIAASGQWFWYQHQYSSIIPASLENLSETSVLTRRIFPNDIYFYSVLVSRLHVPVFCWNLTMAPSSVVTVTFTCDLMSLIGVLLFSLIAQRFHRL